MARGQGLPLDPARLRAARTAAGLSQRQVAAAVGTTRQQVIRYEAGAERPEVRRLAALAAAVGVGVGDLVEEGALPAGLAGLRVGAGLTLAAAAGAVRAQLPAEGGIACSRPVLADAERGTLPPSWAPPPAAGAVRTALGVAYGAGAEKVVAAWETTFGTAAADTAQEPGSENGTSSEGLSETAPPSQEPREWWRTARVRLRRASTQRNALGQSVTFAAGKELVLTQSGCEDLPVSTDWSTAADADTGFFFADADVEVLEELPDRSRPLPEPVSQTTPPAQVDAELPFADPAPEPEDLPAPEAGAVHLELLTPEQTDATEMGAARMWRVRQGETPVGYVWRTDDAHQRWAGARADADGRLGDIASLTPTLHRTRRSVVEHLLDPDSDYFTAPAPRAPAAADAAEPQQDGARAVAVLLTGDPGAEHPYLWVKVDGETIGHLEPRNRWDGGDGWVMRSRPTEEERRTLSDAELGGRPPEARTTLTDVDAAARELLDQVLEDGVYVGSLHGHHTGPGGVRPDRMARWELYRGRVPGRSDVYTGSTCHGWLQDAPSGGHTAHTRSGPVAGGPWPTRGEAVVALWGHLTAPLPPPPLTDRVHARRTPRKRFDVRPMCPYTDAQLAAHQVVEAEGSEKGNRSYEIVVAGDTVGTVRRLSYGKRDRAWEATADADPRPGETVPPRAARGTREDAVWALLARPGPLWADPTSETLH